MNFKKKLIYFVCLITSFSQIASSAVERIDFLEAEIPDDEMEAARYAANAALTKAGISERLTNESPNGGVFGAVFFTSNYAVKLSEGEYFFGLNNTESARLSNVKDQIQANTPAGMKFCLPEHIYKVYVDGQNYWDDDNEGYNIQIMPRIRDAECMANLTLNCIKNHGAQNMSLMQCFGEKMGQFQNWGLVRNSGSAPDKTCMHGDLNPENVLVTNKNAMGTSADFTFVDNAEYSAPQVIPGVGGSFVGGASLVSDITRLCYFCAGNAIEDGCHNWEYGLGQTMENFFKGYIPQLPKEVCEKLMTNLYGNPQACLSQTNRDNKHGIGGDNSMLDNSILDVQSRAFYAAYRAAYPTVVLPQNAPANVPVVNAPQNTPVVVPVANAPQNPPVNVPVVQPLLNKAQQKQLARQQKVQQKVVVKAQKDQKKELARQQKADKRSAARAQKDQKKELARQQKAQKTELRRANKALKTAAKQNKKH